MPSGGVAWMHHRSEAGGCPGLAPAARLNCPSSAARLHRANGAAGRADGRIDVHDGALAQPAGDGVILLARDIRTHLSQQLQRRVQAAALIRGEVDAWVVLDVLAVIDRSMA